MAQRKFPDALTLIAGIMVIFMILTWILPAGSFERKEKVINPETGQTAVVAYQFGDGISNMIIPTSGVVMGLLSTSKIPYDKWFRFAFPLIILLSIVAMLLLVPPTTFYTW